MSLNFDLFAVTVALADDETFILFGSLFFVNIGIALLLEESGG